MTLEILNSYLDVRQKLAATRDLRERLMLRAQPGAQNLDGMPHAPGVSDKVGNMAIEIAELGAEAEALERQAAEMEPEISDFISRIPDPQTRVIFRLRFSRCLTWPEVADVIGGGNTEAGVKMVCYRFLEDTKQDTERSGDGQENRD